MAEKRKKKGLPKDLKFEDALTELEEIVGKLEAGELSLEECLAQFEKGTELSKFCEDKLKETAKRIEILKQTGPGEAAWAPLEEEEETPG